MASSSQPQAINLADLDVAQLSDVKRQLEEVCICFISAMLWDPDEYSRPGIESPHKLICATQASSSKVQDVH